MDRSRLAIQILSVDVRNARSRNRHRIVTGKTYGLAIDKCLTEIRYHLHKLRIEVRRIEKLEQRELDGKKIAKQRRSLTGQNTRLTGTYGK